MRNSYEYAKELVSKMTIEEKMSQMVYQSPAIERLGIPTYNWWNESLHGVARAGVATMFPQAIALAATFDETFIEEIANTIATEGRAKFQAYSNKGDRGIYKGITFWAPNINIFRDPRWGRGHETFGEDPVLTALLGVAYVKGLQGKDSSHLLSAACAKHFAVHSGPEELRHEFDAVVSKKDLYETYLYAFKRLVKDGKVEAVMGAYNRVNGEPACGSKTLLKDILRNEWGFNGHVVSDCWAIIDFHEHHGITNTVAESAALAVNTGCDLNCGSAFLHLPEAYRQGLITEKVIDESVIRLIDTRIRLGMLEEYPSPYEDTPYELIECKEHIEQSLEAARRSMVLLKNNGILPLNKEEIKTIGVIGPNGDSREGLIGNYTGTSSEYVTPLEGIRRSSGEATRVLYAEGAHLYKDKTEFLAEKKDRLAEALCVAEMSDVVIMCLGLDATIEGEEGDIGNAYVGGDKADLFLPGFQQQLLEEVAKVGKPIILLLSTGSAMDIGFADQYTDAIIQTWYSGARGGIAIGDILFGKVSPSGKLPITFYDSSHELPEFTDYSMKNRTYRFMEKEALYPFGFGLHYGKIEYNNATMLNKMDDMKGEVVLTTEVRNNSNYSNYESIQVYVSRKDEYLEDARWQLKNIKSIYLQPMEEKTVTIRLDVRDFARINNDGRCIVEPGEYTVYVGGQQPDRRSKELTGMSVDEFVIKLDGKETEVEY